MDGRGKKIGISQKKFNSGDLGIEEWYSNKNHKVQAFK